MKFDWYQASIPEVNPHDVMSVLAKTSTYGDWEESRPIKGYDVGAQFVLGGQVLYKINHGGQNEQYGSNVLASGGTAQKLSEVIRENFPNHKVSRMDSCADYHHADVYAYLRKMALKIAKERKVKVLEITKPDPASDDGRTLYLGSDQSPVSMRIYEKGKQLGCETNWVRAELQIRPKKEVKTVAAFLSPVEVWGLSKWSHAMAVQMGQENLQRVDVQIYQQSDQDRAYRFMLKQYRKVFEHMLASHGSAETVGAQIFHDLAHIHDLPSKAALKPV